MMVWGVLLLVISCATVEPTRVENGLYINPDYKFSLRVPDGCETSEELPDMFKNDLSFVSRLTFKTTFYDPKNKFFILVAAQKTETDWMYLKIYSDIVIKEFNDSCAKEQKKFLNNPDIDYWRYEIYKDQIKNCDGDCIVSKFDFQGMGLKGLAHNIFYKGYRGMAYTATLVLITYEERNETCLKIFKTVVDSFQRL